MYIGHVGWPFRILSDDSPYSLFTVLLVYTTGRGKHIPTFHAGLHKLLARLFLNSDFFSFSTAHWIVVDGHNGVVISSVTIKTLCCSRPVQK